MMIKSVFASALLCVAVAGCGKKGGGGDIKTMCEDNFAHGEMNDGTWTAGKGDKTRFMDYCVKQRPDVVRCSSMTIDMGDESCKKHTGIDTDGFAVKIEINRLRNEAGGTAAAGSAAPAAGGACGADRVLLEGPQICVSTPAGYVKPLDTANSKDPTGGNLNVSYSSDGTVGGAFVATFTVTYNAAPATPPDWSYFEKDAAEYCDTPPTIEDIADGHGKFFQCASKKLDGHSFAKSKTVTAKNLIECSSQSANKADVDAVCKTLEQL